MNNSLDHSAFEAVRLDHRSRSDPNGADWCRHFLIGPIRKELAATAGQAKAKRFYARHCDACGLCAFGDAGWQRRLRKMHLEQRASAR